MDSKILEIILSIDKYLGPLIKDYGIFIYVLLFLMIFIETGFVITPFFPGDSLLFVAGTFAATGALNLFLLLGIFSIASILGDSANYWLGDYFGVRVFSKYIKKDYLNRTKDFYERYGPKTIIIARFVPLVRTLAPFVAGVSKMKYSKFFVYNVAGGILWVFTFVFLGYFFGTLPFVKKNLTISILVIIILSILLAVIEVIKYRKNTKKQNMEKK